MTALAPRLSLKADPRQVLIARAEARAILYREGEYDLHEAVDGLQAAAVQAGLVGELGQDAVQDILAKAFVTSCYQQEVDRLSYDVTKSSFAPNDEAPLNQACDDASLKRDAIPKSTIDAAEYLVRQGDCARLRKWLNAHSTAERAAIHTHLKGTRCPR